MSVESTREVLERYIGGNRPDYSMIAEDAVYTVMATGQTAQGREAVIEMLHSFYRGAFDAVANTTNTVIGDGKATLEADFRGKHVGDFMGIPATGKEIHVPLCVVYDLENDLIKRARIYFETDALRQQLGR